MGLTGRSTGSLDESALWRVAARTVVFTVGVLLAVYLVFLLRSVLVQLLLAVIVSAGMTPIVDRLAPAIDPGPGARASRRQAPRVLVVVVLYALLLAAIGILGALVIPPAGQQVEDLVRNLPEYATDFQQWFAGLAERYPFVPSGLGDGLPEQLRGGVSQLSGVLGQALVVLRVVASFLGGALNFIFVLFLALYITSDGDRIQRYLIGFLPRQRRAQAEQVTGHIGDRLGGWVRGQIMLSGIIGTITLVGLLVIGVPYAVLLSLIAAVGEAVPMVGPIISAVPAVIVAFFVSPFHGFLTLGLYILVQQVENAVVVPKVMERAVSLHPIAVMMALLVGSELYGVTGAILSVPVAAAISVVVHEIRRERDEHEASSAQSGMAAADLPDPSAPASPVAPSASTATPVSPPPMTPATAGGVTIEAPLSASAPGNQAKTDPRAGAGHQDGGEHRHDGSAAPTATGD